MTKSVKFQRGFEVDPLIRLTRERGSNSSTNTYVQNEILVETNDFYHLRTNIAIPADEIPANFDKSALQSTSRYIYTNTKIPIPTNFKNYNGRQTGDPVYEFETTRNTEIFKENINEFDQLSIYIDPNVELQNKTIVFHSNTDILTKRFGPGKDSFDFYNELNLFNPIKLLFREHFINANQIFNVYERMCVILSDYSETLMNKINVTELTLENLVNEYTQFRINDDLYYLVTNNIDEPTVTSTLMNQEDLVFRQMQKSISKDFLLSYKDVSRGIDTKNEPLFYKVEKWFSERREVGPADQTFLIPITSESMQFIDTQINSDASYTYRVTMYYAVFSSQYNFENYFEDASGITVDIVSRPRINFYSEVVLEETKHNGFYPPLQPRVAFYDKTTDSKGKLKIYLELQKGQEDMFPQTLSETETNVIPSYAMLENGRARCRYRQENARFQVFRTTEPPSSYYDFEEKVLGLFENENGRENMIILDSISTNKTYYYTFRTINELGTFSNPTPIYEVSILQDASNTKVMVGVFHLPEINNLDTSITKRDFKSLLKLQVSSQQTGFLLNPLRNTSGDISSFKNKLDQVALGYTDLEEEANNKIWGRKFKFRVRSNDSGKIIDFNVKVNIVREKSEEDFAI